MMFVEAAETQVPAERIQANAESDQNEDDDEYAGLASSDAQDTSNVDRAGNDNGSDNEDSRTVEEEAEITFSASCPAPDQEEEGSSPATSYPASTAQSRKKQRVVSDSDEGEDNDVGGEDEDDDESTTKGRSLFPEGPPVYRYRPWTEEEDELIQKLVESGHTWAQIAERLERSGMTCRFYMHTRDARKQQLTSKQESSPAALNKKHWTFEEVDILLEMRRLGCVYTAIGKVVGRSAKACVNKYNALGDSIGWNDDKKAFIDEEDADVATVENNEQEEDENEVEEEEDEAKIRGIWTKEEEDLMIRLKDSGCSWTDISRELGQAVSECKRKYRVLIDPYAMKPAEKWTAKEHKRLMRLHAKGWPIKQIAKELSRSEGSVRSRLHRESEKKFEVHDDEDDGEDDEDDEEDYDDDDDIAEEFERRQFPPSRSSWTKAEDATLMSLFKQGMSFREIAEKIPGRSRSACKARYGRHLAPANNVSDTGRGEDDAKPEATRREVSGSKDHVSESEDDEDDERQKPWTRNDDRQLLQLKASGKSNSAIADRLGRTLETVKERHAELVNIEKTKSKALEDDDDDDSEEEAKQAKSSSTASNKSRKGTTVQGAKAKFSSKPGEESTAPTITTAKLFGSGGTAKIVSILLSRQPEIADVKKTLQHGLEVARNELGTIKHRTEYERLLGGAVDKAATELEVREAAARVKSYEKLIEWIEADDELVRLKRAPRPSASKLWE